MSIFCEGAAPRALNLSHQWAVSDAAHRDTRSGTGKPSKFRFAPRSGGDGAGGSGDRHKRASHYCAARKRRQLHYRRSGLKRVYPPFQQSYEEEWKQVATCASKSDTPFVQVAVPFCPAAKTQRSTSASIRLLSKGSPCASGLHGAVQPRYARHPTF